MTSDLDSLFLAEDAPATRAPELPPWPILVVDDDEEVHIMTRLVLSRLTYKGRPLELLTARSAAEAAGILTRRGDIAVALLDIVMETDDAGLVLARRIREEFDNNDVRIVLRTGQPGQARCATSSSITTSTTTRRRPSSLRKSCSSPSSRRCGPTTTSAPRARRRAPAG
ncbi:response regulator [Nitrospirillum viridazoti]|uniref:response regulator n=1 Tax=Nitrospirillum viridazoti TaxID=3144925 RepID=UPI001FEABACA|nr:hypothetical protein [Nitrospirillum amazonense]